MTDNKQRGFEIVNAYLDKDIHLPKRSTYLAAGYDIEAAETITLPSFWPGLFHYMLQSLGQWIIKEKDQEKATSEGLLKAYLVPTGLKAYMQDDEYLKIVNRSSNPLKRYLNFPNSIGIIDADYYNNPNNEGHIYIQIMNFGLQDYTIQKGDRIGQGIFTKFLKADGDQGGQQLRTGGFGSSDVPEIKE